MKKRICILTALLLLLSAMTFSVSARASNQLSSYSIAIGSSGTTLIVTSQVTGTHSNLTKIGFPSVIIYEKNPTTSKWVTVYTAPGSYKYNAGTHQYVVTYTGISGRQYYATANVYGSDSDGYTERSMDSSVKTL